MRQRHLDKFIRVSGLLAGPRLEGGPKAVRVDGTLHSRQLPPKHCRRRLVSTAARENEVAITRQCAQDFNGTRRQRNAMLDTVLHMRTWARPDCSFQVELLPACTIDFDGAAGAQNMQFKRPRPLAFDVAQLRHERWQLLMVHGLEMLAVLARRQQVAAGGRVL